MRAAYCSIRLGRRRHAPAAVSCIGLVDGEALLDGELLGDRDVEDEGETLGLTDADGDGLTEGETDADGLLRISRTA